MIPKKKQSQLYKFYSSYGSWDCLEMDDDILSFTTETAWYRCTEVEDLIKEKYPSIDIAFRCEEPGMAIYEKNNNVFFPEDYIVDIEDDDTYYLMETEALQTLSDFFGIDLCKMRKAFGKMDYNKTPFCMLLKGGCVRMIWAVVRFFR